MIETARIAVIILNWNGKEDTLACLHSFEGVNYPNYELIVVDNGSTDGSVAAIHGEFESVDILETGKNLGYAGGNNVGMRYALKNDFTHVLLLNNDTEVSADFLDLMISTMKDDPQIGVLAPLICYHTDPQRIWSAGGGIDRRQGDSHMFGLNEIDNGQFGNEAFEVEWATGCALLIKREVLEQVGLLDERFFMYYEEVEWCTRVSKTNYRIAIQPQARIWHKITPEARESSPFVHYLSVRNRLLWIKEAQFGLSVCLRVLFLEYFRTLVSWSIKPRWKHKRKQRSAMIKAILDHFRGNYGRPDLKK